MNQADAALPEIPPPELRSLVVQLGAKDQIAAQAAEAALEAKGEAGIAAVLWGLSHPRVTVRGACAAYMDHHATDACFASLREAALHDPAPSVRRTAVHSASCQECKPHPLSSDRIGLLIEVARSDTNRRVRLAALRALHQPRDARAVAALEGMLSEADPDLRVAALESLNAQDSHYRVDAVGLYIELALSATSASARLRALWQLRRLPHDTRAVTALERILGSATDPRVRSYAHHALKHQDPGYKATVDTMARKEGIAQASQTRGDSTGDSRSRY
jgi:HEAT repeat protein